MRNKKIKLILNIIVFIIIILISNNSIAAEFQVQQGWQHKDAWNNNKLEFLSKRLTEMDLKVNSKSNKVTLSDNGELILCKQKGGSIRFTPVVNHVTNANTGIHYCPTCTPYAKLEDGKTSAKTIVENMLENVDYYKASTKVSGIYKNYVGSNYPEPSTKGKWSSYVYYSKIVYCTTPVHTAEGNEILEENNTLAYIMSSGSEFSVIGSKFNFKTGNYTGSKSDEADDQLIQDALWKTKLFNEGKTYSTSTEDAKELLKEGQQYEKFYKKILEKSNDNSIETGYKNSVKYVNNKAQVIVKRDDERNNKKDDSTYIIGPFKMKYPDQNPFSYIEDMYIIAKNAENHEREFRDFEIISDENSGRKYPGNNKYFYISFNAKAAGYPTSVEVKVSFAYLADCKATYQVYKGEGEVYQIKATLAQVNDSNNICKIHYTNVLTGYDSDTGSPIYTKVYYDTPHKKYIYSTNSEKIGKYDAQKFAKLYKRSRTWKRYKISLTDGYMDLTMDLGGVVWEDTKGGKETGNDNIKDLDRENNGQKDKLMSNVIVTLYNKDGTLAKLTKDNDPYNDQNEQIQNPTKTNSQGKYTFTGINSMYQYYVEFTYNSQYYEPVEYINPSDNEYGWGKANWKINSNGTDVRRERETVNAKFASIGSSPRNYVGSEGANKTYSKNELLGKKLQDNGLYNYAVGSYMIIDQYGNLFFNPKMGEEPIVKQITNVDAKGNPTTKDVKVSTLNNKEVESKIQYVKDCQISSYTGNDIESITTKGTYVRSNDLYPIYDAFIIDDHKEQQITSILVEQKIVKKNIEMLYKNDAQNYINQGYTARRQADVALRKDIQNVNLQINGKSHTYRYDTRSAIDESGVINADQTPKGDTTWDIHVRLSDHYYDTQYSREIYVSDYEYKVEDYNGNAEQYGKTTDSELKVYVTYKLTIKNQSLSVKTRIDEIVDYYDKDLIFDLNDSYINENSYMRINIGENKGKHQIVTSGTSRYDSVTMTNIQGYNNLYVQFVDDIYLTTGQTAYLYLTFRVDKDANRNILLDEKDWQLDNKGDIISEKIGVGKENIAEINGYSTMYAQGTTVPNVKDKYGNYIDMGGKIAGIVDKDSNPGNLNPLDVPKDGTIQYKNFEDDTDKSPNIRLTVLPRQEGNRIIDGIVWEDVRNVTKDEQKTTVADGIRKELENGINGVTVQLVELMENGTEYVWKEFSTGQGTYEPIINKLQLVTTVMDGTIGKYVFKSYPAGNYVVRFKYGDTVKTVLPNVETEITNLYGERGQNAKSYTGQDYKSTSYQVTIPEGKSFTFRNIEIKSNNETKFNSNESGKFAYDITASDTNANVSDAKDIMKDDNIDKDYNRPNATLNSREDVENHSKTNVTNHIAEVLASHEQLQEYYAMDSTTVKELVKELMRETAMTAETGVIKIEIEKDSKETPNQVKDNKLLYKIQNVNLGLEERPKAQLAINKEVTHVKITLADGSTLFDAKQKATDILWEPHIEYASGYGDGNYLLDNAKFGSLENIRTKHAQDLGVIQPTMDEELMHGATIRISYKITVKNVGEVDYCNMYDNKFSVDRKFYYTGIKSDSAQEVTTQANQVIDYVANNLQFNAQDSENKAWEVIKQGDLIKNNNATLVNINLKNNVEKYNTIITTNDESNIANAQLKPGEETSDTLVLTQLITSENDTDDLTYSNIVEIVKTSNIVGRRNQYSVVGNQKPDQKPQELDSDVGPTVKIMVPFGNGGTHIIIATTIIIALGMLTVGIIFIKKKVIK